jgi:catechol 2,3-dioxygenase-like lactoylglutathione lyase family enzyme
VITGLSHTTVWVLDQDEALAFYKEKLGFEVHTDATMDDFRWLTVNSPDRPEHELALLVPGPPMMDEESAEQVKKLVAKGVLGAGAFETDDCRATHAELSARGVTFLSEPTERFYGIEATFRDNSGNWFSMTQRVDAPVAD